MRDEERQNILKEIDSFLFSEEVKNGQLQYSNQLELHLNNADGKSFLSQRKQGYSIEEIKADLDMYIKFTKGELSPKDIEEYLKFYIEFAKGKLNSEKIKKYSKFYIDFTKGEFNDFDLFNLVAYKLNKSGILNVNKKAYNELMLKILGEAVPREVINILELKK
ncbi:hypothetical protein KAZ01_01120 [Candidatus Gracilibacteria bacterium]|nr:hypothetical protein [Candidatus Gracilibacteria bacterium]